MEHMFWVKDKYYKTQKLFVASKDICQQVNAEKHMVSVHV
jgi:hypothetical protein